METAGNESQNPNFNPGLLMSASRRGGGLLDEALKEPGRS
jgi:hypothetical protein